MVDISILFCYLKLEVWYIVKVLIGLVCVNSMCIVKIMYVQYIVNVCVLFGG